MGQDDPPDQLLLKTGRALCAPLVPKGDGQQEQDGDKDKTQQKTEIGHGQVIR